MSKRKAISGTTWHYQFYLIVVSACHSVLSSVFICILLLSCHCVMSYSIFVCRIGLVGSALLDHFLGCLGLLKQFEFLQTRFFMQDGEFSQCLCNLLFNRFSRVTSPSDLLNPITLNSILSKAALYSHTPPSPSDTDPDYLSSGDFEGNLAFAVRFVPESFTQNCE